VVAIKIPTLFAARAYGSIKPLGTIKREEWRGDGSWYGELSCPQAPIFVAKQAG
jgi:ribosome maturation protein Sdo1